MLMKKRTIRKKTEYFIERLELIKDIVVFKNTRLFVDN